MDNIDLIQIPLWQAAYPWLDHGFSTRLGGVSTVYSEVAGDPPTLNLGWTREDDPALVTENRRRLVHAVTGASAPAITLRQVHGTILHPMDDPAAPYTTPEGRALLEGDGLLSATPGALLGIQTADCIPVMLLDPEHRAVAVLHAGWRGTAAAIAETAVARMTAAFGSRPEALEAAIGPSIGPCCYTVGDEVRAAFSPFPYAPTLFAERDGQLALDLWQANRRQLLAAGLPAAQIETVAHCTGCARTPNGHRRYFSHRLDHGHTGRMMSLIGIAATP